MEFFKKQKLVVIGILLPALLILMGNSIVNLHTHYLDNGVVVSHAHPYKKLPDNKQHSHSNKEFFFLQQLTAFFFCLSTTMAVIILATKKISTISRLKILKYREILCHLRPNRAPPAHFLYI